MKKYLKTAKQHLKVMKVGDIKQFYLWDKENKEVNINEWLWVEKLNKDTFIIEYHEGYTSHFNSDTLVSSFSYEELKNNLLVVEYWEDWML